MKRLRLFLANVGHHTHVYPLVSPPLGIMALAAYVRTKFDMDILLVNQRLDNCSNADLVRRAADFRADLVGFSSLSTAAYRLSDLTRQVRQALPNALILLGGPHPTGASAEVMATCAADAVVTGEGELALEQIIEAYLAREDFSRIPGLVWRDAEGNVIRNPGVTPMVADLDSLPRLAYDLIDMRRYWRQQSTAPIPHRKYISLVTSRGCPYRCIWCHNLFGKSLRAHSPERIADEIAHYQKTYQVDDFEILDDNFNLDANRLFRFCELLPKRNIKVKLAFPNGVRGDLVNEEAGDALAAAGAYLVSFALETGSPRLQEYTCKRLNIPRFLKGVEIMAARGVYVNGFCMLGFPTETEAELQQTIDVACESQLHTASFFTVTPFPGTPLYDMVFQDHPEKIRDLRYDDMDLSGMRVNLTDLPAEVLYAYQRKANRQFYLNPRRILRLLRDYPKPHYLPLYALIFLYHLTKGMFDRR